MNIRALSILGLLAFFSHFSKAGTTNFTFVDSAKHSFTSEQKELIKQLTNQTLNEFEQVFKKPNSPMKLTIRSIDRDLSDVYGVTGRADRPDEVEVSISSVYKGGIKKAIEDGFRGTLLHELHHTVRGWTIHGNKFPQGIDVATINEGLADVFAEVHIGRDMNKMPKDVDFNKWTMEILALPKNANYGHWMGLHPDGRMAVGYRTGAYIVKQAMKNSQKDIKTLSQMSVDEIYQLAGVKRN